MNKLENLKKNLSLLKKEQKNILPKYLSLQKKITNLHKKISSCQNEIDKEIIKSGKADWKFLLSENGFGSTSKHEKRNELLYNLFGVDESGYLPKIKQVSVRIKLIKGDKENLENTHRGLLEVLPFVKIHPDFDRKVISIFERSLCSGGVYSLRINEKQNKYELNHSYREEKQFPSLLDALKYIQENHWYETIDKIESREEEDDY